MKKKTEAGKIDKMIEIIGNKTFLHIISQQYFFLIIILRLPTSTDRSIDMRIFLYNNIG